MSDSPAKQYAKTALQRAIEEQNPRPTPFTFDQEVTLNKHLILAFNAGADHAAARFMEMTCGNPHIGEGTPSRFASLGVDRSPTRKLTDQETNTILHGLRTVAQNLRDDVPDNCTGCDHFTDAPCLDSVAIDALCESIGLDSLTLELDGDAIRNAPGMVVTRLMTTEEAQELGASLAIDWSKQPDRMARKEAAEDAIRASLGIDSPMQVIKPEKGTPIITKAGREKIATAERERLNELMDQVAREAIASVNESAAATITGSLYVGNDGYWCISHTMHGLDFCPVSWAEIKHYDTAEDLADALRSSVSA